MRTRGPVLFTLAVGLVVALVFSGPLTSPLATPHETAGPDEPEVAPPNSDRTPLPEELHSQWFTQTVAPTLTAGETADVSIQFRNVGHTAWILGSPSEIRLGEVGERRLPPEMRVDWPAWDRPARQTEPVVYPQQLVTFSFKVAGAVPGVFRMRVRPVVDGVTWLEDDGVFVDITVR